MNCFAFSTRREWERADRRAASATVASVRAVTLEFVPQRLDHVAAAYDDNLGPDMGHDVSAPFAFGTRDCKGIHPINPRLKNYFRAIILSNGSKKNKENDLFFWWICPEKPKKNQINWKRKYIFKKKKKKLSLFRYLEIMQIENYCALEIIQNWCWK